MNGAVPRPVPLLLALLLAACGTSRGPEEAPRVGYYKVGQPYQINGRWYYPEYDPTYDRVGTASWYGEDFEGLPTANGEIFDKDQITAAHPTLPLPSLVRVTNLENGRSLTLRVNDRGPFVGDRLIDLSQAAARKLGYEGRGLARVRVTFLQLAEARGTPPRPVATASSRPVRPVSPVAATAPEPPRERPVQMASVVAPTPAPPTCPVGPHYVQVGAFAETDTMRAAMATVGRLWPVRIEPTFLGERAVARVRLGPIADGEEARTVLRQVQARGYTGAFLIPAGRTVSASC